MVRDMRVAVAQMDIAWMDRAANWATIRRMVGSANLCKGDYLLLPELADEGLENLSHHTPSRLSACESAT